MKRQEYIFKHASEISERKVRTAQKLQSEQAMKIRVALAAMLKSCLFNISRLAGRGKQSPN